MTLEECRAKHTDRQMEMWLLFLDMDLNRPDKVEHYLASVACEVRRIVPGIGSMFSGKSPSPVSMKDLYLEFKEPEPAPRVRAEDNAPLFKQPWIATAGGSGAIIERRRSRAEAAKLVDEMIDDQERLFSRYPRRR